MARPTKEETVNRIGQMIKDYHDTMKKIEKGRRSVLLDDYHRKIVGKYRNRIRADQENPGKNRKEDGT